jgi:hypothetical protein
MGSGTTTGRTLDLSRRRYLHEEWEEEGEEEGARGGMRLGR